MTISIKDIAKVAGVNHSTVSRALADHSRISLNTRERIKTIAQEMGYHPSAVARGLATQKSQTIGVIVASLTDPYATEVIGGIESAARNAGYRLILTSFEGDARQELAGIRAMKQQRVDGVIIVSSRSGVESHNLVNFSEVPVVLLNNPQRGAKVYSVSSDNIYGAMLAVNYLISLGHQRIGIITGQRESASARERLAGFRSAHHKHGLKIDDATIYHGDSTADSGEKGLRHLMGLATNRRPSAIFCNNDVTAIGCLHAAHTIGIKIPNELSVVGFDNIELSAHTWPALTTVDQRKQEMGRLATNMILELINGAEVSADVLLRGRLVQRDSCAHACA